MMPGELAEVSDTLEPGQNYATSYLAPGEVFAMTWQGGGGYGDPLTREPDAVARDVREQKVTAEAARAVYGVVIDDGAVNAAATAAERGQHRARRRERSQSLGGPRGKASLASARRLDDNLVQVAAPGGSGTVVACRHCAEILGGPGPGDTLTLAVHEGPPAEAGPQILANPADYVDAPVVFRQYCCPGCWTALYSAVVPAGHVDTMTTLGRLTATSAR
jgi:N-methylhydantoinase B